MSHNVIESSTFDAPINVPDASDSGTTRAQDVDRVVTQLANRTRYLKTTIEALGPPSDTSDFAHKTASGNTYTHPQIIQSTLSVTGVVNVDNSIHADLSIDSDLDVSADRDINATRNLNAGNNVSGTIIHANETVTSDAIVHAGTDLTANGGAYIGGEFRGTTAKLTGDVILVATPSSAPNISYDTTVVRFLTVPIASGVAQRVNPGVTPAVWNGLAWEAGSAGGVVSFALNSLLRTGGKIVSVSAVHYAANTGALNALKLRKSFWDWTSSSPAIDNTNIVGPTNLTSSGAIGRQLVAVASWPVTNAVDDIYVDFVFGTNVDNRLYALLLGVVDPGARNY